MTYKVTEEGNVSTVFLNGEIDMDVTESAKEVILPLIEAGKEVHLNLKDVSYMDSSGISVLIESHQQALEKGAWSAAVNAEVARGKAAGLYIEQKIIRTGKLEDLTAEELESRMKSIIDEYSPILEGVDEKELKERVLSKPKSQKDS